MKGKLNDLWLKKTRYLFVGFLSMQNNELDDPPSVFSGANSPGII